MNKNVKPQQQHVTNVQMQITKHNIPVNNTCSVYGYMRVSSAARKYYCTLVITNGAQHALHQGFRTASEALQYGIVFAVRYSSYCTHVVQPV